MSGRPEAGYVVAVAGATGAVGSVLLSILEERAFPVSELRPLASKRSAGRTIRFRGEDLSVAVAEPDAFNDDDFAFFERFCDPDFVFGPTLARIDGILALRLANADIIPYDITLYSADLARHARSLEVRAEKLGMQLALDDLHAAVAALDTASRALSAALSQSLADGPHSSAALRRINKGLIALERIFVREDGLQGRPWSRSLYAAPDPFSGYAAWMLPGLRYEIETDNPGGIPDWEAVYVGAVEKLTRAIRKLAVTLP